MRASVFDCKGILERANANYLFTAAAFADVSLPDIEGTVKLKRDGSFDITVPEGYYVEMNITFSESYGFFPTCKYGSFFEIRDGLNKYAHLLGKFCEFLKGKEHIFRSSGRHMWLKFHESYFVKDDDFHANYTAKQMNATGMYLFPWYRP